MLANGVYTLEKKNQRIWLMVHSQLPDFGRCFPKERNLAVFLQWHASWKICLRVAWENLVSTLQGKKILWCACDEVSATRLKKIGITAGLHQHNLLCREDLFFPEDQTPIWDAIYTGALEDYKRPWLARKIKSLRILARNYQVVSPRKLEEYGLNHAEINRTWVSRDKVREEILKSHCGLALSPIEGAMNAATEYLLCGVPIVTTPSLGGRDIWYTAQNHRMCQGTPEDVAAKVASYKENPPNRKKIAEDAKTELLRQRRTFVQALEKTFGIECKPKDLQAKNHEFRVNNRTSFDLVDIVANPNPKGRKSG